jgi:hypothetical protein
MINYCIRPAVNPIKTGNKCIDFVLIVAWSILPGIITVFLTVFHIEHFEHALYLLTMDFIMAESTNICIIILIVLQKECTRKDSTPIFDFYCIGVLWYVFTICSSVRLVSELDLWVTLMGIAPIVTFTTFVIIAIIMKKCNCHGSYKPLDQS